MVGSIEEYEDDDDDELLDESPEAERDFSIVEVINFDPSTCTTSGAVRLDQFVSESIESLSRAQVQKLIEAGKVTINNVPVKASRKLKGCEQILVTIPPAEPLDLKAEEIPLKIVFEDKHLVVVNKAAGMVTHPGAGVQSGTLVNALLFHCRGELSGVGGVKRPGIVHRLDKDTSGLLVVAKDDATHKGLVEQISQRSVKRVYNALVEGVVEQDDGTVNAPIGRHRFKRKMMAIVADGRRAVTHYRTLQRYRKFTMLEATLETGRTHQIRVHMASLGYPVAGDLVYNRKSTGTPQARKKMGLVGHALHAARLSFMHPQTREQLSFEAPLPADFQAAIQKLS